MHNCNHSVLTRRGAVGLSCRILGGLVVASTLKPAAAAATPTSMQAAMRALVGNARISPGKVSIELPPLVENGNAVPITVSVDSPMTDEDYVKSIHVFNEKNPQPHVIDVQLGPRAGRAIIST